MPRYLLFSLLFALILIGCADSDGRYFQESQQPIMGGELATGHPAVVGLMTDSSARCSGALISPTKVLTAAHCVRDGMGGYFYLGPSHRDKNQEGHYSTVRWHPAYATDRNSDIAIAILDHPIFDVPYLELLPEPLTESILDEDVIIVGFGPSSPGADDGMVKREAVIRFNSLSATRLQYNVAENEGRTALEGDSGGPALVTRDGKTYIIGVTQGGISLFGTPDIGYYTRVDVFADWITAQGVPPMSCTTNASCPGDDYCLGGACIESSILPCSPPDWGCPTGSTCTWALFEDGQSRVACVQATSARLGQACSDAVHCDARLVCSPEQKGESTGTCVPSCRRTIGETCGGSTVCAPLPGSVDLGRCLPGDLTCTHDTDCSEALPRCHEDTCQECITDSDCPTAWSCEEGQCRFPFTPSEQITCVRHNECTGRFSRCDMTRNLCVECRDDYDCPIGGTCANDVCSGSPQEPGGDACRPDVPRDCGAVERCAFLASPLGLTCVSALGMAQIGEDCTRSEQCAIDLACVAGRCALMCKSGDGTCGANSCTSFANLDGWGFCVHCDSDESCPGPNPYCDPDAYLCRECLTSDHCDQGECQNYICSQNQGSTKCESEQDCPAGWFCNASNICVGCMDDRDCNDDAHCDGLQCVTYDLDQANGNCACAALGSSAPLPWQLPLAVVLLLLPRALRRPRTRA